MAIIVTARISRAGMSLKNRTVPIMPWRVFVPILSPQRAVCKKRAHPDSVEACPQFSAIYPLADAGWYMQITDRADNQPITVVVVDRMQTRRSRVSPVSLAAAGAALLLLVAGS